MTRKSNRRRTHERSGPEFGLDETVMVAGAYALLVAGALATGLTGSWLPMLGTTAAVIAAGWFVDRRSK